MRHASNYVLLACLALAIPACAPKQQVPEIRAVVTRVLGADATVKNTRGSVPAAAGMDLSTNETLFTGPSTKVLLTIADEHICLVSPGSVFRMSRMSGNGTSIAARLQLTAGRASSFVRKLSKESVFEVETPVAVVGVRGTVFDVAVMKDGACTASVLDGTVEVARSGGEGSVTVRVSNTVLVPVSPSSEPVVRRMTTAEIRSTEKSWNDAEIELSERLPEPGIPAPKESEKTKSPVPETAKIAASAQAEKIAIPEKIRTEISEDFSKSDLDPKFWTPPWVSGSCKAYVGLGRFVVSGSNSAQGWNGGSVGSRVLMMVFPESELKTKRWVLEADVRFRPGPAGGGWSHGIQFLQGKSAGKSGRSVMVDAAQDGIALITVNSGGQSVRTPTLPYAAGPEVRTQLTLVYDPVSRKASAYADGRLIGTGDADLSETSTICLSSGGVRTKIYAEYDNVKFSFAE